METVVIIPEDLFRRAEELAAALGMSRSEIYAAALAEFLRERRDQQITARLNEVYDAESPSLDPVIEQMQSASLPMEQW